MKNKTIFRVQDKEGRGPYKPGVSDSWHDWDGPDFPTCFQEFPHITDLMVSLLQNHGGCFGCGFANLSQLHKWFSDTELKKLQELGYSIVEMAADKIICQSKIQLVFWRKIPLSEGVKEVL